MKRVNSNIYIYRERENSCLYHLLKKGIVEKNMKNMERICYIHIWIIYMQRIEMKELCRKKEYYKINSVIKEIYE